MQNNTWICTNVLLKDAHRNGINYKRRRRGWRGDSGEVIYPVLVFSIRDVHDIWYIGVYFNEQTDLI